MKNSVNPEDRYIQKEKLVSEKNQSRNIKIKISKENAARNNTIIITIITNDAKASLNFKETARRINWLKYISQKIIRPVGKTGANNNTIIGWRKSWSENSRPIKKRKYATNE